MNGHSCCGRVDVTSVELLAAAHFEIETAVKMKTAMAQLRSTIFPIIASFACFAPASAKDILEHPPQPVVVEMFLSQACPACPPAAEYMTELATRDDVIALSWHIDYWDYVAVEKYGRWKDPFAKPAFSNRQKAYNKKLRGRRSLFTPQAVVNGSISIVGSHRDEVSALIDAPRPPDPTPSIRFTTNENGALEVTCDNLTADQMVYVVTFRRNEATPISGGKNAGLTFVNANIVEEMEAVTAHEITAEPHIIERPAADKGCAVIVQNGDQGAVTAAAYCPSS